MTTALDAPSLDMFEAGANPIRVIRTTLGLSLRDAADRIGCHHQALYMNETGAGPRILPVVLDWLVENSDFPRHTIELAYWNFVQYQRDAAKDHYGFVTADLNDLGRPGENPIEKFHEHFGLTRSAWCKTVCVSASLMYTVENPGAQHVAASIPPSLLDLFRYLGVSELVISEMIERYGDWHDGLG